MLSGGGAVFGKSSCKNEGEAVVLWTDSPRSVSSCEKYLGIVGDGLITIPNSRSVVYARELTAGFVAADIITP